MQKYKCMLSAYKYLETSAFIQDKVSWP